MITGGTRTAALLVALTLTLAGCGTLAGETAEVGEEVTRIVSPDGEIDAVLTESNSGATASFVYDIHILPHGQPATPESRNAELSGATRSKTAYGVTLSWSDADTVLGEYLTADVVDQASPTTSVEGKEITVVLRDGQVDPDAPAGGMATPAS